MKSDRQYKDSAKLVGIGLIGILIMVLCTMFLN